MLKWKFLTNLLFILLQESRVEILEHAILIVPPLNTALGLGRPHVDFLQIGRDDDFLFAKRSLEDAVTCPNPKDANVVDFVAVNLGGSTFRQGDVVLHVWAINIRWIDDPSRQLQRLKLKWQKRYKFLQLLQQILSIKTLRTKKQKSDITESVLKYEHFQIIRSFTRFRDFYTILPLNGRKQKVGRQSFFFF